MYQLKRRSQNCRSRALHSTSTSTPTSVAKPDAKDSEEMLNEIEKELRKKKPNYCAIKEMQKITFKERKSYIQACDGRTVVDKTLQRYSFLQDNQLVSSKEILVL